MGCLASKKLTATRGFTLLELIIYLAVVSIILVAATLFSYEFVLTQAESVDLQEVNRNARYAIDRIGIEIREATDVNTGTSTFGANPGTLSLATASGGTNPTVINVSGTTLQIKQGAGATLPITNNRVEVTEFQVDNLSVSGKTKAIRVHIRVKSKNPSNVTQFFADTTVETTARVNKNDGFSN